MKYLIGNILIIIPNDHMLPVYQALEPYYDRLPYHYLDALLQYYPDDHVLIDIGANVGDTAAILRNHSTKHIVCYEGNTTFTTLLKNNAATIKNITIKDKFILDDEINDYEYIGGHTTGGFSKASNNSSQQNHENTNTIAPSTVLAENQKIALIKSDTDGFDGLILEWFTKSRHLLFYIECDPAIERKIHGKTIIDKALLNLIENDYDLIVFDNHGWPLTTIKKNNRKLLSNLFKYIESEENLHAKHRLYYIDIIAVPPELAMNSSLIQKEIANDFGNTMIEDITDLSSRSVQIFEAKNNFISIIKQ